MTLLLVILIDKCTIHGSAPNFIFWGIWGKIFKLCQTFYTINSTQSLYCKLITTGEHHPTSACTGKPQTTPAFFSNRLLKIPGRKLTPFRQTRKARPLSLQYNRPDSGLSLWSPRSLKLHTRLRTEDTRLHEPSPPTSIQSLPDNYGSQCVRSQESLVSLLKDMESLTNVQTEVQNPNTGSNEVHRSANVQLQYCCAIRRISC